MKYQIEKGVEPKVLSKSSLWREEFIELCEAVKQMEVGDSFVMEAKVYVHVWQSVRRMFPQYRFKFEPLEIANEDGVKRRVWRVL